MNIFFAVFYAAFVGTVLTVLLRNHKAEAAIFTSVAVGALILTMILPKVQEVMQVFNDLSSAAGVDNSWLNVVFKICGIAFIGEWGVQLCKDSGEGAIGSKLELATKVTILLLCLPIINQLLQLVEKLL